MGQVEKTVFISYRRTNMPWALAIYQNLTANGYDVFFDYDSIPSGDFEQIILSNIRARAHFLVVLTPSALERCVNPDDWLRREIEMALEEKRNIVPVFLEGFNFDSPSISPYLTGKLEKLKKYNGQNVPAGFFEEALKRIRDKFLNVSLEAVLHPVSDAAQEAVRHQQASANGSAQIHTEELTAQEWFEKAYNAANPNESISYNTKAIELKPDFAEAYYNRGTDHAKMGSLDLGIEDLTEAIRLKPEFAEAYYNRGTNRVKKGDLDGALEDLSKAIHIKPDFVLPYINRGSVLEMKGDLQGALQDYAKAQRLNPNDAVAHYNHGSAQQNLGNFDGALKAYAEAIRLDPVYFAAYYNRGLVLQAKGDLDGALRDFTDAIRVNQTSSISFNNRGLVLQAKGDIDGALLDFAEAIRLDPNDALVYLNRSKAWIAKEDYHAVLADLERYLRLGNTTVESGDREKIEAAIREFKKGLGL